MHRQTKLTDKDMSVIREGDRTKVQRDKKRMVLRDYSLNHRIELIWDLNDEANIDQMVKLRFDGQEAIVDAEEFLRGLRWV